MTHAPFLLQSVVEGSSSNLANSFHCTGLIIASSGSEFFHVFHVILTGQTLNLFFPFFFFKS